MKTKDFISMFIVCTGFLINCNESPETTEILEPVGTWTYTEDISVPGVPASITMILTIKDNSTYSTIGLWSNGSVTITAITEEGIWTITGNKVTMNPSKCQEYDFILESLINTECGTGSNYILNGNSMTDGTTVLKRE